jgi:hypothetical protein
VNSTLTKWRENHHWFRKSIWYPLKIKNIQ